MKPYTVVLVIEVQAEDTRQAAHKFYEAATDQPPVNVLPTGTPGDDALESLLDGAAESVDLRDPSYWEKEEELIED